MLSPLPPRLHPCEMECKRIAVKSSRVLMRFRMRSPRRAKPQRWALIQLTQPETPCLLLPSPYPPSSPSRPAPHSHPPPCPSQGPFARCPPGVASALTEFLTESHFPYTCVRLGEAHSSASEAKYAEILEFCSAFSRPALEIILPSCATCSCDAKSNNDTQIKLVPCDELFAFKKRCHSFLGKL